MSKQGSILGGALLIMGSCVGAGMLGLPVITGLAGFFPTLLMFVIAWLFMTTTALLILETTSWFEKPVNLISMVAYALGPIWKVLCWVLYLFLFYSLLVAYMSLSGNHVSSFLKTAADFSFPDWGGTLFFVSLFGCLVYMGTYPVDYLNRFLMIGKIGAFLIVIGLGMRFVSPHLLGYFQPKYALFSFPILITSFGFQNMIPSIFHYMGGDRVRIRKAIWLGSIFTVLIYLIWEIIVLGILPSQIITKSFQADIDGAQSLKNYLGSSSIGYIAQILAFFAILTSFLAQSLSLVHFLRDGFKITKKKKESVSMCFLALLPPLFFSIFYRNVFFQALSFAGGICATFLFGIFPALMVWIGRYRKKHLVEDRVRGGKSFLILILIISCFIFFYQITQMLSIPLFPKP